MQAKDLLVFLTCIFLEAQSGLAVEDNNYLNLFSTAAIIRSTHGLKITADADQLIDLSCTSECGILSWEVNLASISSSSHSVSEVEHFSVELCTNTAECSNQNTFLDCESANEQQYLVSHLLVRPRDNDLVVQCVSGLAIGSTVYTEYSRAVTIRINRTKAESESEPLAISPSSTISHLPSSSPAASISIIPCSLQPVSSSIAPTTSQPTMPTLPSRPTMPTLPTRSTMPAHSMGPSQLATVDSVTLCFVDKQEFTFALIGISGGLLVLTLIGWILVLLLCCKNKRAQKEKKYWNDLSSKESTLDRIQPYQSSTGSSLETNLFSSITPINHITHYEHSPQLPLRSHNPNTDV